MYRLGRAPKHSGAPDSLGPETGLWKTWRRLVGYPSVTVRSTDTVNPTCNEPVWESVPTSRYGKIAQCSAQQAGSVTENAHLNCDGVPKSVLGS
jgi:hypothetical protein